MTYTPIILGQAGEQPLEIDLDRLIGSHLGVVANSGGGKSGLVRRLLEQTHGRIQHIVLDGEDEFYTLRERYEYVIAGGEGGDVPATVDSAESLAIGALTHGFSLIAQLNDLGADGAPEFIGRFLTALINAPRALWHPVLVVVDEAQRFAPRVGSTAATDGIRALLFQGRKRGFTAILAGTKFTEIDPSVRGMVNNWMLGRVGQAVDRNTMAEQLGFTASEGRQKFRGIEERHFYALGGALTREPTLFRVADVETTPIHAGQAKVPTPPAPEALRAILAGLAVSPDEPEAKHEGSVCDSAQVRKLEARVADLETERDALREMVDRKNDRIEAADAERERLHTVIAAYQRGIEAQMAIIGDISWPSIPRKDGSMPHEPLVIQPVVPAPAKPFAQTNGQLAIALAEIAEPQAREANTGGDHEVAHSTPHPVAGAASGDSRRPSSEGIPPSQQRVIDAIAWWAAVGISPVGRDRASVIAGLSPKASTFGVYVSKLVQAGLVATSPGQVALTEAGRAAANSPGRVDKRDVVKQARSMLKPAAAGVFDKILAHWPDWVRREEIADECGLSRTASTLGVYISQASQLGFVETKPSLVRIAAWLMP